MRVSFLLLAALVAAGCAPPSAPDEQVDVADDALVGGAGIVGPITVEADRLVIQRAGNEALLRVNAGRVLVGAPEPGSPANEVGFLRKAISAHEEGDRIAILTE